MVGSRRYTSTYLRTRMERPWRIVGPRGRSSNGLIWMSRTARARSVNVTCTFATTAIIISGRWRGRRRWSTVWCAVRTPHATSRGRTFSPEAELSISMPRWCMGWDVFCWLGHRRFARHWSVPQLRAELQDTHQIRLSDDAIEHYIGRYQTMLAARQQDPAAAG